MLANTEQGRKGYKSYKGRTEISSHRWHDSYVENPMTGSIKNVLDLLSDLSKVNKQKSILFLYINNNWKLNFKTYHL